MRLRTWRAAQATSLVALALLIAGLIACTAQTLPEEVLFAVGLRQLERL